MGRLICGSTYTRVYTVDRIITDENAQNQATRMRGCFDSYMATGIQLRGNIGVHYLEHELTNDNKLCKLLLVQSFDFIMLIPYEK